MYECKVVIQNWWGFIVGKTAKVFTTEFNREPKHVHIHFSCDLGLSGSETHVFLSETLPVYWLSREKEDTMNYIVVI